MSDDALLAANWLCDERFIDDHRTGDADDPWLAGVAQALQDAADYWPEMAAKTRRLVAPLFARGDGFVKVYVLWVDSKAHPLVPALDLVLRQRGIARVCVG